jgi:hypothetical protein
MKQNKNSRFTLACQILSLGSIFLLAGALSAPALAQNSVKYSIQKCWALDSGLAAKYVSPAKICVRSVEILAEQGQLVALIEGEPFPAQKLPIYPNPLSETEYALGIPLSDKEFGSSTNCALFGHTEILFTLITDDNLDLKGSTPYSLKARADYQENPCTSKQWKTEVLPYKLVP